MDSDARPEADRRTKLFGPQAKPGLTLSDARSEILLRVRQALGPREIQIPATARNYRQHGQLTPTERLEMFEQRVAEYRAEVVRVNAGRVVSAVEAVCERHGIQRLGTPASLPATWLPQTVELVQDRGLSHQALDGLDGALTGCTVAAAATGTIALTAGEHEGRRALTLVPDRHICVVQPHQIVELIPEAIALLGQITAEEDRPITLISGPSATSDIELSRVEGVHGPRTLVVIITETVDST
jgi:L-lactate dehydrogenase complex protein LldG